MSSARNLTGTRAETRRTSPRRTGLIWSVLVVVAVAVLLLTEQVALLYVVATLSVSALLIVVAFASFGEARAATEPVPFDDSAVIADRSLRADPTATAKLPGTKTKAGGQTAGRR